MMGPNPSGVPIPAIAAGQAGSEWEAVYLLDGDCHRWMLPAAGMEVCLRADALERMAADVAAIRRELRPGEQIGGLLLGRRDFLGRDSIGIAHVESFSATALHQLLGLMSRRRKGPDGGHDSLLGWYRFGSGEGLGFTRLDEALMQEHLAGGKGILLLLRPSESAPSPMRLVFERAGELRFASTGFPALPAPRAAPPAAAPVPPEPEVPPAASHRGWKLAGITLVTALLVFTAGVLWNAGGPAGQVAPQRPASTRQETPPLPPDAGPAPRIAPPANPASTRPGETARFGDALREFVPAPDNPPPETRQEPELPPDPGVPDPSKPAAPQLSLPFETRAPEMPRQPENLPAQSPPVPEPRTPPAGQASRFVPAVPLSQPEPVVPANVRSMIVHPVTVVVKVTIDAAGKVVDAQAMRATGALAGFLAKPAIDAARRWRFKPALLDGHPVLSTSTIQFTFEQFTFQPRR